MRGRAAFCRVEPRRRARAFVLGLLADLPRKNCWSIAEHAGDRGPEGMQYLLGRARWDADAVRDDVRGYVTGHLGDPGAVLVADETGDLKKGACTAGVQRQYSGTAGRIENCQVAVYLTYAAPRGHALIDRELYLPRSWIADPQRCRSAGIPSGTAFATKPALDRRMIARALEAGAPASWVAGDEVYGTDPGLRSDLENRGMGYVLAVARSHYVQTSAGKRRADQAASEVPRSGVAALLRRRGRPRAPLLRLGLDHHHTRPGRVPLAADPPPPPHRRAGLLPLLLTPARPTRCPDPGRGPKVDRGRGLPVRQGPDRPG